MQQDMLSILPAQVIPVLAMTQIHSDTRYLELLFMLRPLLG
jgi:hypothetical protein